MAPDIPQAQPSAALIGSHITKLLLALPILVGLVLKIAAISLLPKVMMKSLEDLVDVSPGDTMNFTLDEDQRSLILDLVSNEALKTVAILTFLVAIFDGFLAVYLQPSVWHLIGLSLIFFAVIVLLFWLIPMSPQEMTQKAVFGLKIADWVTLIFCLLDITIGSLSLIG